MGEHKRSSEYVGDLADESKKKLNSELQQEAFVRILIAPLEKIYTTAREAVTMRISRKIILLATLSAALAACSDTTPNPVTPQSQVMRRPSFTHSDAGRTAYTYIEVKKNGRAKLYRVKIKRGTRSIEFETVAEETNTTSSVGSTCDDPTLPGCETNPEDPSGSTGIITGELDIDGIVTDTVDTGLPWNPSYSSAGWDGTGFHCKSTIDGMHFNWKNHYFETEGESQYMGRIPSSIAGVVKGRYSLPNGPWLSTDGRARIWSGTVDANCYFEYAQSGFFLIEAGFIVVYRFNGDYEELGSDATFASHEGGSEYGGEVYHSLDALRSGDPAAYAVVRSYLDTGNCTEGWVIVIDGVRVC
ncbi:MAG TPA: hypothetical protein VF092_26475 [Longimicrobium sp.]